MKIVINRCFGGFGISEEVANILGISVWSDIDRNNNTLINLIEERGSEFVSGRYANLEIVEIPDEVTDWEINEYDGIEEIICVINGKLVHIK